MENFNEVYNMHHKLILNYVYRKVNDYSIAEELTNDIFMKLHRHFDRFDEAKASMKTWIFNIANNTVIDHYRKVMMDSISIDSNEIFPDGEPKRGIKDTLSGSTNPFKEMVTNETLDIVQNEINSLSKKKQRIANLFFNEDLSYEEISSRLDLPLGTVKGQIFRVRKILVYKLQKVRA